MRDVNEVSPKKRILKGLFEMIGYLNDVENTVSHLNLDSLEKIFHDPDPSASECEILNVYEEASNSNLLLQF
jgi:hypothetical protein